MDIRKKCVSLSLSLLSICMVAATPGVEARERVPFTGSFQEGTVQILEVFCVPSETFRLTFSHPMSLSIDGAVRDGRLVFWVPFPLEEDFFNESVGNGNGRRNVSGNFPFELGIEGLGTLVGNTDRQDFVGFRNDNLVNAQYQLTILEGTGALAGARGRIHMTLQIDLPQTSDGCLRLRPVLGGHLNGLIE